MKKRFFAFLLVVCMVASMLPVMTSAEPAEMKLDTPVLVETWEDGQTLSWTFTPDETTEYYFHVDCFVDTPTFVISTENTSDVTVSKGDTDYAEYLGSGFVLTMTAGRTYTIKATHQDGGNFGGCNFAIHKEVAAEGIDFPADKLTVYSCEMVSGFLTTSNNGVDTISSITVTAEGANQPIIDGGASASMKIDLGPLPAGKYTMVVTTTGGKTLTKTITVLEPATITDSVNVSLASGSHVYYQFKFDQSKPYVFYVDKECTQMDVSFYDSNMAMQDFTYNDSTSTRGWAFTPVANETYYLECWNSTEEPVNTTLHVALGEAPTGLVFDECEPNMIIGSTASLCVRTDKPNALRGTYQWSSSDPSIITPVPEGEDFGAIMESQKSGFVTITVTDTTYDVSTSKVFCVHPEEAPQEFAAIFGNGGTFDILINDVLFDEETAHFNYPAVGNNSLESLDVSVTEPEFWTERGFIGWNIYTYEHDVDENGNEIGDVLLPNAENLTTSQMLAYTLPAGKEVNIHAQWAGDDNDYYTGVGFHAYGGEMTILQNEKSWKEINVSDRFRQNGEPLSTHLPWTIQSVDRPGFTFRGWLMYRDNTNTETGGMELLDDTIYSMQDILVMPIPVDETTFVAKYDEIPLDEYRNAFSGNSGEEGPVGPGVPGDSFFPTGTKVTELTKGTKVIAPADGEIYNYSFTAPAEGYYALNIDTEAFVNSAWFGMMDFNERQGYKLSFYMMKDEVFEFHTTPYGTDANVWIDETPYITKLEVVDQDTSLSFLKSDKIDFFSLLEGLTVKATFSDKTVVQKTLTASYDDSFIGGFAPRGWYYDWANAVGNAAAAGADYISAPLDFKVKLENRMPVKLEVIIPDPVTDIYEYSLGSATDGPLGEFYQYHIVDAILGTATWRVTWDDDSVEDFNVTEDFMYGMHPSNDAMPSQEVAPWGVGSHTVMACLGDFYNPIVSTNVTFEILPNPIDRIEFIASDYETILLGEPETFLANGDGTYRLEGIAMGGLSFKAYFKDGTSKVYTWDTDMEDWVGVGHLMGGHLVDMWYDDEQAESISKPGKITTYLSWMGAEDTFETNIVESIVTDEEVAIAPSVVDEAIQSVISDRNATTVTLDVTQSVASTDTVTSVVLPRDALARVAIGFDMGVEVKLSGDTTVTMDNKALTSALGQAEGSEITLVVNQVKTEELSTKQQKKLENKKVGMVITAQLLSDGQPIWTKDDNKNANQDGNITISVPFTPPAGTKGENFSVWFIDDEGEMTKMPTKFQNGKLVFTTWHLSEYVALENEAPAPEATEPTTPSTEATEPSTEATTPSTSTEATTPSTEATKPSTGNNPSTGDPMRPALFGTLMVISLLAAAMVLILRKKIKV